MENNQPRVLLTQAKTRFDLLVEQLSFLQKEVFDLKRGMKTMIEREVERNLGDKIAMIDGALTETILQKEILIAKGLMTRDEINQKYAELRNKKAG